MVKVQDGGFRWWQVSTKMSPVNRIILISALGTSPIIYFNMVKDTSLDHIGHRFLFITCYFVWSREGLNQPSPSVPCLISGQPFL